MSGRNRVTIVEVPIVIAPDEGAVAAFAGAQRGELVRPLPAEAADRHAGARRLEIVVDGWQFEAVVEPATRAELRERAARAAAGHVPSAHVTLLAQIPGRVVRVWVSEGDAVEADQPLLAIEAMKMENQIRSPHAGTVSRVSVDLGGLVERNDELLTIS